MQRSFETSAGRHGALANTRLQRKTKSLVASALDQKRRHGRGWSSPRTRVTARGYVNKGKVAILVE